MATKECKVCTNKFVPCQKDFDTVLGNWRRYCCCIDCAQIYYKKVLESRNPNQTFQEFKSLDKNTDNEKKEEQIDDRAVDIKTYDTKEISNEEKPKETYSRRKKNI